MGIICILCRIILLLFSSVGNDGLEETKKTDVNDPKDKEDDAKRQDVKEREEFFHASLWMPD